MSTITPQNFQMQANNINVSVEEIFRQLEITFDKKSSGDDIQKAQKFLMDLDNHILELLKLILEGISHPEKFSENIKLSALIYLKNNITTRIKQKKLDEEEVWQIMHIFIEFLISTEHSEKIVSNINNLLQLILSSNVARKKSVHVINLYRSMEKYLMNMIEQNPINDYSFKIGIFKRMTAFFSMIISTKAVNETNIEEIYGINLSLIDLILGKNISLIQEIIKMNPSAEQICPYFETNRQILDLLFLIIIKLKDLPNNSKNLEILIAKYAPTVQNFIVEEIVPNNNMLVYITENEELDKVTNSIKAKSFQFLSALIQYGSNSMKNEILQRICIQLIDFIRIKLDQMNFIRLNNFEKYEKSLDILFYHIFLFLSRCLNREPILSNFFPYIRKFIVFTILPFLISTQKERVQMKTEGEEYQSYITDLVGDHKSKSSRVSVDFLIVRLAEKYDGMQNFLCNFCLQILDFGLNCNSEINENTIIPEHYDLLVNKEFQFQDILKNFTQENLIDVAMIIFCSFKAYLGKNKTLIKKLKAIFDENMDKLHNVGSDLIKFDVCLVYDSFLPSFFDVESDPNFTDSNLENQRLMKRLDFLLINLMNYEKNPGISSQSARAITTIFNESNPDEIDGNYMSQAFSNLIPHLENIDLVVFFEVITDILCSCKIEKNLISCIDHATKRILKEVKSAKTNNPQREKLSILFISKCVHILNVILKENKLESENNSSNDIVLEITETNKIDLNQVEKIMEPLMSYLKNPHKIDFDDELLDLLKSILNNVNTLSPLSKHVFEYLPMIIEKNEGMDSTMFKILNLYITKDDGFIFCNAKNMEILISMLLDSVDYDEENEFSPICASVLLQVLPNNKHGANINNEYISKIIEKMVSKLTELNNTYFGSYNHMNSTIDMHAFTSFLTTIYSYFIKYPNLIFSMLSEKDFFNTLMTLTDYINLFTFFSTQQSKIIILGFCSMLNESEISTTLNQNTSFYTKMISQLFTLLYKQKQEESRKMKTMLAKEFDCNFVDSDDDENEEDDENEDDYAPSQMMEYKKAMKALKGSQGNIYDQLTFFDTSKKFTNYVNLVKNPVNDFDEYEIFSNLVQKLRRCVNGFYEKWESTLEGDYKTYWDELIKTRRININYEGGTSFNVPRRIVKIKRRNESNQ